jgi:hypothetical protein
MHSTRVTYLDNGLECQAVIHHNSDWSGDAIIMWGLIPNPHYPNISIAQHEAKLPGRILQALVNLRVACEVDELVGIVERLGGKLKAP